MSRPVLFNFSKLKEFYHQPRELTADEQNEIGQIWKTRINRKEYDDREGIQELRAILADTPCKECSPLINYAHTTTIHQEHQRQQKLEELEQQAQQVIYEANQSLEGHKPTEFAPSP